MEVESESNAVVNNRSVPTNSVLPHIVYQDVSQAIEWLSTTFGFTEYYCYGPPSGPVQGAQIYLGDAWIMLESARGRETNSGQRSQYLTIIVSDVNAHYEQAKSAGTRIIEELNETVYGERHYGVEDLEGHFWLFSQHSRDLDPEEWGARVANRQ